MADKPQMTEDAIEFFLQFMEIISEAKKAFGSNYVDIKISHHAHKDYYTIDCSLQNGNAEYKNCVVFYLQDFDRETVLEDLRSILYKAKNILN
ncbi:MAG TPA: hypothetical protein VD905_06245 [Flavobacteriales bacterium]|nr:hypothetical protein [Flavobacteriales bacterium]